MISISKAGLQDIPAIQQIAHTTWPVTFGSILSPEQIRYMLDMMYSTSSLIQQISERGHVFLIASIDSLPAGFAGYELTGTTCKLHKIYILPQMQGRKIGQALIASVTDIARENGAEKISLNVNRYNPAVGFYEKIGFYKAGEEDIDIGQGYFMNDFIMQLDI